MDGSRHESERLTKQAQCPDKIKVLIEEQHARGIMIPYRRRDFAAHAMLHEILHRSHVQCGMSWGAVLPTNKTQIKIVDANAWSRLAHIVVDDSDKGESDGEERNDRGRGWNKAHGRETDNNITCTKRLSCQWRTFKRR